MTDRPTQDSSAAIIGAGGNIGSQTVPHLARMLNEAILVDPDVYTAENLRGQFILPHDVGHCKAFVQAGKMKAINASLAVLSLVERVEDVPVGLLRRDVLVGGLDSKLARMRMNRIAVRLGVPIVDAGIRRDGMLGRITVCQPSRGTACLECGWSEEQYREMARRTPCLEEDPVAPATDAPSELGGLVAAYQVMECRKLLAGEGGDPKSAYQILIDLVHHKVRVSALPLNPSCRCDHRRWEILPLHVNPSGTSLGRFFDLVRKEHGADPRCLGIYGKVFILGLTCPLCGARRRVARLQHRLSARQRTCPRCGSKTGRTMIAGGDEVVERLGGETQQDLRGRSLSSLGFRPYDIVTVWSQNREVHYELCPTSSSTAEGRGHAA